MATTANSPPGATGTNGTASDPFTTAPSHAHPAPLRYAPFDNEQFATYSTNSPSQARRALEAHLKDTDRRIQDASKLGTTLLQQRKDLAARLKDVEDLQKDNEVPLELRQKLSELEKEYNEVGRESARAFLPKSRSITTDSVPTVFSSQARDSPSKVAAPSRRQRNQPANRFHDIEFATEISTQLLAQVRQLQAALSEKDEELQNVNSRKTQLEDEHTNVLQRMKQLDSAIQGYKDENWNLEGKIQELETSLRESSNTEQRLNNVIKTTQTEKSTAQRELEDLRVLHEKAIDEHTTAQRQQEGDLHTLRRDLANHENEKLSTQRKIEELTGQNTELAKAVSYRLMNQGSQHFQPGSRGDKDADSDEDADDLSDPASPIKGTPARAGMLESETLKSSLNHAHRMIQNLKNNIHREKTEKLELKRMLSDARDELEKKRETGVGGITAANMSKKRRSEAETVKFRKPSRPERLGASRTTTTEILEDEPDWTDHEDPATPSKSRFAAPAAAGAAAASAIMPGSFSRTDTESSDAFETADERSRDTATETEAFQTGAESLGEDSDELTETESNVQRSGTIRMSVSPNTAARPSVTRDRISYMSTASTSADESDEEVVRTPVQSSGPKYRVRVSRGPNSRTGRPSDLFSDSPVSSAGNGTPQPAGKSLGDELDALDDDDDSIEGTPDSRRTASSRTASPETTRMANVEPEFAEEQNRGLLDSVESIESSEDTSVREQPEIGSPFSSPVKTRSSPRPKSEKSVLAHQANSAMLAHETTIEKPAMVDAGMMTEPWAPEKEVVVQRVASDEVHDEDAHKNLRQRAGDLVGGALAGFGLGRLGGKDESESQEKDIEAPSEPRSVVDDPVAPGADPDMLAEPKTLSNHASVQGLPRTADEEQLAEPSATAGATAEPLVEQVKARADLPMPETASAPSGEPKVLRSSVIEPQQPPEAIPQQKAVPLQTSEIMTQETEPVAAPAPVVKKVEPVAFGLSGVSSLATEPVSPPRPEPVPASAPVVEKVEPLAFSLSGVSSLATEPVSPPRPAAMAARPEAPRRSSSRGLQGLTDAASRNKEALAAAGVSGAAGAVLGAKSAESKPQPLDFSSVEAQDLAPVEMPSVLPTPLLPRRSSKRMDELYAGDALPVDRDQAIPGTDSTRPGAGYFASPAPSLSRSRSKSMPATDLQRPAVPDAVEPRVYGGGKGSGNIPTLIFGAEDDYDQASIPRASSVKMPTPVQEVPASRFKTPESEGVIPATEPLKIRKPMIDGGCQTEVSGQDIDRMVRDKSTPAIGLGLGAGVLAGAGAGYMAGRSPRHSIDAAITPNDSPLRAPRRPASSGSMRNNSGFIAQPPLPEDHTLKIIAAGGKPAQPTTPSQGAMGPPTMPASAYRHGHHSRPKTPVGGQSNASIARTVSKEGTTPRPSRTHASPSGVSRRTSVSSFASELDERFNITRGQFAYPDDLPPTTDPRMIQAITQTMIGEYLWKYTRKAGRSETSSTRHRRFFWVHPYTRTLYWSEKDPSTAGHKMLKAKSLPIESVRVITDDNAYPPGLHRKSLVVITPGREIVFTAPTGQRHETWFNALSYLLLRTEHERADQDTLDDDDLDEFNPQPWSIRRSISRMTGRSSRGSHSSRPSSPARRNPTDTPTLTTRPSRLSATQTPTLRATPSPAPPAGGRMSSFTSKFRHGSLRGSFTSSRPGATSALSHRSGRTAESEAVTNAGPEIYNASVVGDSAEDLRAVIERQEREADRVENVRACCDGKHDVGSLASRRGAGGRHGHSSFMGRTASHGQHGHQHAHAHAHPRAEPIKDAGKPRRGE